MRRSLIRKLSLRLDQRVLLFGIVALVGFVSDSVVGQTYDGTILDQGGAVINVKSTTIGAVGDGVANDTVAIQAAVDAVPGTGGTVYFPPGIYMIDTVILRQPNITLRGSGAIIRKRPNVVDHVFKDTAGIADGFRCYDLRFDLSRGSFTGGNTASAFFFVRTNDLQFVDCEFKNGIEEGLKLYKCKRVRVDRCHFENIYDGGVQIHSPNNDGYTGSSPDQGSADIQITRCYFKDIDDGKLGAGNGCGVMVYNGSTTVTAEDVLVQGNIFVGCTRGFWAEDNDALLYRLIVQNNDFIGSYYAMPGDSAHGAGFVSAVQSCISNNTFYNIGSFVPGPGTSSEIAAIIVTGSTGGDSDLVQVTDNTILDDRGSGALMQFGIYVTQGTDLSIEDNRVRGANNKSVHVVNWSATSGTVNAYERPVARLTQASPQGIPSGNWTTVSWTSESYDNDNMHDNVVNPSRVRAERTGRYRVVFNGGFVANATGRRGVRLYRSDGVVFGQTLLPAVSGDETSLNASADIELSAGQYVFVCLYQNSGSSLATQGGTQRMSLNVTWIEEQ